MSKTIKLVTGIEVNDAGEQELVEKEFPYPIFVPGGLVKKAIDLGAKLEKSSDSVSGKLIDDLADFTVELYGKQFTRQELVDGVHAEELMDTLLNNMMSVLGSDAQENETKKFIEEKSR